MKPQNIFLVRHGESLGNVDKGIYAHTPDWKVSLTEKGHQQAKEAAEKLKSLIAEDLYGKIDILRRDYAIAYCSPWERARETAIPIVSALKCKYLEDPRLREQEWGNYQEKEVLLALSKERDRFGTFFYRLPNGESGADVYDRISTFLETLYRDFNKSDYPVNAIIVTHGLTLRCFLMRFFHLSVEAYEKMRNPKNGAIIHMKLNDTTNKYDLITKMEEYKPEKSAS